MREEALVEDRPRFRKYMSQKHLGLGVVTAGPGVGKTTASRSIGRMETAKWKGHFSLVYWLLMLIRSPAVSELSPDDSPALHQMQTRIDGFQDFERLRRSRQGRYHHALQG
ncbi:hypothetical protein EDB80DRAFT_682703 [Ilyonectria destructans]|nr:hypothetical protein EDB80DRAFT_682703 [Ilyonectria destructans]